MSQTSDVSTGGSARSNSLPAWVSSGVLGLVIGAGGTLLGLQGLHPQPPGARGSANAGTLPPGAPSSTPGMGGGGMGMGMGMGGGGGGMGGGAGGKRALTMLVGKLELLSRPDLNLHIDLDADQTKAIAAKLSEWENSKAMSADEAQANLDSLEAILSAEQKDVLAAIGLPGGRGGGAPGGPGPGGGAGGGPPASGTPAGGPPGGAGMVAAMGGAGGGGMMGRGNADPNENPFTQEANQKRLRDLLERLDPSSKPAE